MAEEGQVNPLSNATSDVASGGALPGTNPPDGGQHVPLWPIASSAPPAPAASFFRQHWLTIVLVATVLVIVCVDHNELLVPSVARTCIVLVLAAGLLIGANRTFFPRRENSSEPLGVRFVIAFDSVVFVIVGLAATTLSCNRWEAAVLLAGSCLLIGGFFGLLFGYPQGVAQQTTQAETGQTNTQTPGRDKNLLADSAATLGKVITGFTLAKLGQVSTHYSGLCHTIGPLLASQESATAYVLAGVIIAYFLATGFLSGLLLPPYFMSDRF